MENLNELDKNSKFAFVVSRFNEEITENLLGGGKDVLTQAGISQDNIEVFRVPGAWEIPLIAEELANSETHYSAIVCLGCVIKGQTSHDEHINRFVSLALGELGMEYRIPITFGILTVNNHQQAVDRSGGSVANRGAEATHAAVEMCRLLDTIRST